MFSRSKIFIFTSLAFIIGIFFGSFLPFDQKILAALAAIFLFITIIFWSDKKIQFVSLMILFLILGVWRYGLSQPQVTSATVQFYNGQSVYLSGIVSDEADVRQNKTNLILNIHQLKINKNSDWQDVNGRVLVQTKNYPEYNYGDELIIKGELKEPPEFEDFSYRDYLSRYQIYSTLQNPEINKVAEGKGNPIKQVLLNIKSKFNEKINQTLPEPQASLLAGILLGSKRVIPQSIIDDLNKTGLTHIVVISGYNITIIASILLALSSGLSRRWSFTFTLLGILLFTILVGAGASVVRAAIMGAIGLLAFHVERKNNVLSALLLAATLMLLWNPKILRFDIGFQLSFLSTLGLIFLAPSFEKIFKRLPKIIAEPAALTLSAQIFTIPIILYNFHRFSLIAPLANILVLPIIPIVMIFGFVGTCLGFVIIYLGQFVNWATWFLLTYILKVAKYLASIPLSSLEIKKFGVYWLIIYYVLLSWFLVMKNRLNLKVKKANEQIEIL